MLQCVKKPLCFAVFALASVSLLYSQTVECAETKLTLKLNTTPNLNITQNFTLNEPQVLPIHRLCSGENVSYCINGHCLVHENINTPSCTCHPGFYGTRCEHWSLSVGMFSNPEEVIALSCGVMLLLVCVCVLGCFCYRKCYRRGSKPALSYKNQENSV